ncbi:MAG: hypothetical protein ABMA64_40105, partial [Myxococcota bacterium]
VVASHDPATDTFTLARDRGVWALASVTPGRWRTVWQGDLDGNEVDYHWLGDRLEEVTYGGAAGEPALVSVWFGYTAAERAPLRAERGEVLAFDERLRQIDVRSAGPEGWSARVRYVLSYLPGDEWVDRIDREEVRLVETTTPAAWQQVAAFSWTPDAAEVEPGAFAPPFLDVSSTSGDASGHGSTTALKRLGDASGDGLPDALTEGHARWQRLDATGRWWEDLEAGRDVVGGGPMDRTVTEVVYEDEDDREVGTYGVDRVADVDGDGLEDLVYTHGAPLSFADDPLALDLNRAPASSSWSVRYGVAPGAYAAEVTEVAPYPYTRIGSRPDLPEMPVGSYAESYVFEGDEVGLSDVDGDGWLDVVEVVPYDGLYVYWRTPSRGAGWEGSPERVLDLPLVSLSTTLGWVEEAWVVEYVPERQQQAPTVELLEARTGLVDVNADGVPDWVDTWGWTESAPEWQVWLGTGGRSAAFEGSPRAWPAPTPWWSRTDEGTPTVTVCTIGFDEQDEIDDLELDEVEVEDIELREADPASPGSSCQAPVVGRASAQLGGLLDVDGDGRPDLVVGESQAWHRNEGDGFGEGRALPAWWPVLSVGADGHTSAALSVGRTRQAVAVPAVPPLPYDPSATSPKGGFHQQMLQVVDLDRDGMPDLVDRRSPSAPVVQWSRGVRGGLLAAVVLGAGAETTLEYTSSSELAPSGTDAPQHAALRKDVLTAVEVWDPVTGYGARRESTYAGGWSSGVRWWGFEEARHDEYVWGEPDVTTSAPIPAWQWLGAEETGAWVGRDVVLVESRSVWTDRALGYLDGGAA